MPDVWVKPPSLAPDIPTAMERQRAILDAERRLNSLGWQIVTNYDLASMSQYFRCSCVDVTWDRVMIAGAQVGVALPDKASSFGRLWYSHIEPKGTWLNLPWMYRGTGAAGAMASIGLGSFVDSAGIWAGKLQPGAVMQAWNVAEDYFRVMNGDPVVGDGEVHYGHSFIFLNYVHSDSDADADTDKAIIGMQIADNGFRSAQPNHPNRYIKPSEFAVWFGANHTSGVHLTDLIY